MAKQHDHTCSESCINSEEHMRAMDADADRQIAEAEEDEGDLMAGSYNHCVDEQGRLLAPEDLCGMLECMSGDVVEAVEEMYGMIWWLATRDHDPDLSSEEIVEQARRGYQTGLASSPGVNTE